MYRLPPLVVFALALIAIPANPSSAAPLTDIQIETSVSKNGDGFIVTGYASESGVPVDDIDVEFIKCSGFISKEKNGTFKVMIPMAEVGASIKVTAYGPTGNEETKLVWLD